MVPEIEVWGRTSRLGQCPSPLGSSLLPPQPRGLTVSGAWAPLCFETTRRTPLLRFPTYEPPSRTLVLGGPVRRRRIASGRRGAPWEQACAPGGGGSRERRWWDCVVTAAPPPLGLGRAGAPRPAAPTPPHPLGGARRGILRIHHCIGFGANKL